MPPHTTISDLWMVAGVLLGFQITSFTWRVAREVEVARECGPTWLPPADILNLVSMIVTVMGVFVLPILGLVGDDCAGTAFGLSVVLFLGVPFALAGHYDMLNRRTERSMKYFPQQEQAAIFVAVSLAIGYLVLACL